MPSATTRRPSAWARSTVDETIPDSLMDLLRKLD